MAETSEAGLKQRPGDQPLPTRNDRPDIQSMVIADIAARREVGIQRYGTALQPHNGRDGQRDLYEELLDACMYTKQVMVEGDDLRAEVERLRAGEGQLRAYVEWCAAAEVETDGRDIIAILEGREAEDYGARLNELDRKGQAHA